jgi:hypothetical protein
MGKHLKTNFELGPNRPQARLSKTKISIHADLYTDTLKENSNWLQSTGIYVLQKSCFKPLTHSPHISRTDYTMDIHPLHETLIT